MNITHKGTKLLTYLFKPQLNVNEKGPDNIISLSFQTFPAPKNNERLQLCLLEDRYQQENLMFLF